nr:hypothetical protein [Tanacetum cinerariifolium]
IHAEEEIQGMIDSLDKSNETIAKYLQEYQELPSELPLEKKIELISNLVKYHEHYTKEGSKPREGASEETKSSKEAPEIETSTKEFPEEKIKEMMQLVPVEDVQRDLYASRKGLSTQKRVSTGDDQLQASS